MPLLTVEPMTTRVCLMMQLSMSLCEHWLSTAVLRNCCARKPNVYRTIMEGLYHVLRYALSVFKACKATSRAD